MEAVPVDLIRRYEFRETRMAAKIIAGTNPVEWAEVLDVLRDFELRTTDLVDAGGNESKLAARLNGAFRDLGWREGRVDTEIKLRLALKPHGAEVGWRELETEVANEGYLVDNVKGRIALDVEWNAKDGNLDRDIGAYRSLYDSGLIDAAIMITRTQEDLRPLAQRLALKAGLSEKEAKSKLGTTTTTNLDKLKPRMTRGDLGGCPFLAVCISADTWEGAGPEPH